MPCKQTRNKIGFGHMEKSNALELAIQAMSRDFANGVDKEAINKALTEIADHSGFYYGGEVSFIQKLDDQWWSDLIKNGYKPEQEQ